MQFLGDTAVLRIAKNEDILRLISFANKYWGSEHPIINYTEWFMWHYINPKTGHPNFAINEDKQGMRALCGFIPASNAQEREIWLSFLVADPHAIGAGMELVSSIARLTNAEMVASVNIKRKTLPFYRLLGFEVGTMDFFYRLSDKENYHIAKIQNKIIPPIKNIQPFTYERVEREGLQLEDIVDINYYPHKDIAYLKKRYFDCPFYQYQVWRLHFETSKSLLLVTRESVIGRDKVIHIIDIIGDMSLVALCGPFFQMLLDQRAAEYIDCYCAGVPHSYFIDAGLVLRRGTRDVNIIPTHLAPPLESKNVEIYYCSSQLTNFVAFRGDGDCDRPYKPHVEDKN